MAVADESDDDDVEPPLPAPATNIRIRVSLVSKEIIGVKSNPIAGGCDGVGAEAEEEEQHEHEGIERKGSNEDEAAEKMAGGDCDYSGSADGGERGVEGGNVYDDRAMASAVQYRDSDDMEENDDEDDPGTKDDSSYSDYLNEDDEGDEEEEESDVESENGRREGVVVSDEAEDAGGGGDEGGNGEELMGARVRLTSGHFEGKVGTIVASNRGWYTLDRRSGVESSVREKDFEVIEYPGGSRGGNSVEAGDGHIDDKDGDDEDLGDEDDESDLIGATVRIRGGKFDGLKGIVNERQSYRHVQLDSHPHLGPVHVSEVELVGDRGVDFPRSKKGLEKMLLGARVRLKKPHRDAGAAGKVLKVIVGDWFITDNRAITNAYREDKFEVIRYSASVEARRKRRDGAAADKERKHRKEDRQEGTQKQLRSTNSGEEIDQRGSEGERGRQKVTVQMGAPKNRKRGGAEVDNSPDGSASRKRTRETQSSRSSLRAADRHDGVRSRSNHAGSSRMASSPALTASGPSPSSHAAARNRGGNATDDDIRRDLVGALIRINKGQYKGLTGIIRERLTIRRLQLDSLSTPLDFSDVEVIEYASYGDSESDAPDDFAKKYQKYVGARVRVVRPEVYSGREGKVIRVIVLGDWYITDNPDIPMAFPEHKFDVVEYPSDNDDDEVEFVGVSSVAVAAGAGAEGGGEADVAGGSSFARSSEHMNDNMGKDAEKKCKTESSVGEQEEVDHASAAEAEEARDDDWSGNRPGPEFIPESPTANNHDRGANKEGDSFADNRHSAKDADHNVGTPSANLQKCSAARADDNKEETSASHFEVTDRNTSLEKKGAREDQKEEPIENHYEKHNQPQDRDEAGVKEAPLDDVDEGAQGDDAEDEGRKHSSCPLIGATVYVSSGSFAGLTGKIIATGERGWWTVDNPRIHKKILSGRCRIVDDGVADIAAIKEWYAERGSLHRMPSIVMQGQENTKEGMEDNTIDRGPGNDLRPSFEFKHKVVETDFSGESIHIQNDGAGAIEWGSGTKGRMALNSPIAFGRKRPRCDTPKMRDNAVPALNPVLLQSGNDSCPAWQKVGAQRIDLMPAGLQLLPSDTKIEIFNRRTGRIMKGDEAIPLSELPAALIDHAEYEPIIPPSLNSSITTRVGRSGPNVRVSRKIAPQSRVRGSRVEGRNVLVTAGEYRGLSGRIDSCIPGGWYLVSNLFKNDDLDVVVSSQNLELIPEKATVNNASQYEKHSVDMIRIHLKAAKLRLDSFTEERNMSGNGPVQVKRLDAEISKTEKLITDLQKAIDRRIDQTCENESRKGLLTS